MADKDLGSIPLLAGLNSLRALTLPPGERLKDNPVDPKNPKLKG